MHGGGPNAGIGVSVVGIGGGTGVGFEGGATTASAERVSRVAWVI